MIDGVLWLTHRYAYVHVVAPIPDGYTLDHLCHTRDTSCPGGQCPHRLCCNPAHLEPVTRGDNTLHGRTITAANVAKTHCPKNHPYTAENTLIRRCGRRMCRECARERARRYYWAKKGMPGGADKGMGRPD